MTRLLVLLTAGAMLLFTNQANAQPRDFQTEIPVSVQNKARTEAINYWVHDDPQNATVLSKVVIQWHLPPYCAGYAGCTLLNGCASGYAPYCWVAVCSKCYYAWFGGYDWLVGTLKHELGHSLGYNHGDPTCTMNTDYC